MSRKHKEKPKPKREKLAVTVRPAVSVEDAEATFDMAKEFHASVEFGLGEFDPTAVGQLIAKMVASPEHDILLAFNGENKPLGMAAMMTHPSHFAPATKCAQDLAWWVQPDARGMGVGSSLLRAVEKWAREQGVKVLTMIALKGSQHAARKYLDSGFRLLESTYIKRL